MAEEEFGVAHVGPIMLPCDSSFIEYAISIMQRHIEEDSKKALIMPVATCGLSSLSNDHQEQKHQQLFINSFYDYFVAGV